MRMAFAPYRLQFKEPSGTSRGILYEKPTFLIKVYDEVNPDHYGIGEAAVFPGLSPEADGNYVYKLIELMANIALGKETDLRRFSSIQFGLEQAILDYSNGCRQIYFPGPFVEGDSYIEINGLIWMGDKATMIERIDKKLEEGFKCLKLKIGAIEWENELELLGYIRSHFPSSKLIIRVDANGAFPVETAMKKLDQLAEFDIHSIEQPIKAGQFEDMAFLCRKSPVAIALDEELIGKGNLPEKIEMIEKIVPQYIILKPALCGGFSGGAEWIELAESMGIGCWITSALESNIGLNAISQWTAGLKTVGTQGLGTGEVFTNNFKTPLYRQNDQIRFNQNEQADYEQFKGLKWHS